MRIALIGYGKMGKAIHAIALDRNHTITQIITASNAQDLPALHNHNVDVAIEFTTPHTAYHNVTTCLQQGIPVVSGTTGWYSKLAQAQALCVVHNTSLLTSSNFSIGVNVYMHINAKLAQLMSQYPAYHVSITEVHHTQKLDAPSGTAITLAEDIIKYNNNVTHWHTANEVSSNPAQCIPITSVRADPTPGTHTITYSSSIDDISITHIAHNRQGFAIGAVLAAEYIIGKQGAYSMQDVISS